MKGSLDNIDMMINVTYQDPYVNSCTVFILIVITCWRFSSWISCIWSICNISLLNYNIRKLHFNNLLSNTYYVNENFHANKYYWCYFIPWLDFLHFHNPHVCWHSNKNFESKILWLLIVSHRLCKELALQNF